MSILWQGHYLLVYVNDCIILSKESKVEDRIVSSLSTAGNHPNDSTIKYKTKNVLTNDGTIKNNLGVEVNKKADGTIELRQKCLIERILEAVDLDIEMTNVSKPRPVMKPLLHEDLEGLPQRYNWSHRSLIGMMGYLHGSTRPDILMATHQCASFNNDPRLLHKNSVSRIAK